MDTIRDYLRLSGLSNPDSIDSIVKYWNVTRIFKSNDFVLNRDQHARHLYFINNGCVRLSLVDQHDEDVTIGFGYEKSIITAFDSFITNAPSSLSIIAIDPLEVCMISKNDFMTCVSNDRGIAAWYTTLLEKTISGHIKRQIEFLTKSPQERYETFIGRSGHLVNTVPLKYIASYLGMKPETLSRIRRHIY